MPITDAPYQKADLIGLKKNDLASIVLAESQSKKWPKVIEKLLRDTSKQKIVNLLLNPQLGYRKRIDVNPAPAPKSSQIERDEDDLGDLSPLTPPDSVDRRCI